MSAERFGRDSRRFVRNLEVRLRTFYVLLGRELHSALSRATPIDTGRAAASWTASLNGPDTRIQPPEFAAGGRQQALEEARRNVNLDQFIIGDTLHISNSIPYMVFLNAGSSRQAPRNFIELTFQAETPRIIRKLARLAARAPGVRLRQ